MKNSTVCLSHRGRTWLENSPNQGLLTRLNSVLCLPHMSPCQPRLPLTLFFGYELRTKTNDGHTNSSAEATVKFTIFGHVLSAYRCRMGFLMCEEIYCTVGVSAYDQIDSTPLAIKKVFFRNICLLEFKCLPCFSHIGTLHCFEWFVYPSM